MSIIKNGCICGGDYYTTTEQCNNTDCKSERKEIKLCSHCESENVYLFAIINGIDVYDCKDCHKRTTY